MPDMSPKAEALKILNKAGTNCTADDILLLSKKLIKLRAFSYARRILAIAITFRGVKPDLMLTLYQKLALCTGKDADLSAAIRYDSAIAILKDCVPDLDTTTDQETLGIAGGIMKRKWESTAQLKDLQASFSYYYRGYKLGIANNQGYCAINAAFVLDLLAHNSDEDAMDTALPFKNKEAFQKEAIKIREEIVAALQTNLESVKPEVKWWVLVTLAEAFFGLGAYEAARPYLQQAMESPVEEWERETTTRQLARIAMLHEDKEEFDQTICWGVLKELINNNEEDIGALHSAFAGKIGLALSGGGFRASLYHIGVLARLAELDVLRQVEVFSCVSGGSIIGAHYYLELRKLLETKSDKDITADDYVDIVERISIEFLAGVQRNLRTRVISNIVCNLKMFLTKGYSRTNRIAELYESELFSRVKDGDEKKERWLNSLYIHPMQSDKKQKTDFNPKYDNWRRRAKVPILILNATTLNTGHNWQFTASWMGESPAAVQKIDGNYRLRRMYYKTDGEEKFQRKVRLGYAVAASAGVPGMFEPVIFPNLFEGKVVRLVDGGVHDNQGICGLLEQDCEVMLISDASGQMGSLDNPSGDALGVPLRANDILMERVRNAEFQDMNRRFTAGLLKGFMFIHLKLGLDVQTVDWVQCEDPDEKDPDAHPDAKRLPYDIRKDMQTKMAAIRTDLDSFNNTEAFALMTSGYLMTTYEFPKGVKFKPAPPTKSVNWNFLDIRDDLFNFDSPESVIKLLDIGRERMFKIWHIWKWLKIASYIILGSLAIGAVYAIYYFRKESIVSVGQLGVTIGIFILGFFVSKAIIRIIRYRETMIRFVTGLGFVIFGFLISWLHIGVFDRWYLKAGNRKKK